MASAAQPVVRGRDTLRASVPIVKGALPVLDKIRLETLELPRLAYSTGKFGGLKKTVV
jgi:hypothetical protein